MGLRDEKLAALAHRQAYADGKETWLKGRRGKEHPKSHAVVTPLGRFGSMALAAEAHGMSRQAVHAAIKNGRPGWTRLDQAGQPRRGRGRLSPRSKPDRGAPWSKPDGDRGGRAPTQSLRISLSHKKDYVK